MPAPSPIPPALLADLRRAIPDRGRLLTRPIDRIAFASDASCYRLIPLVVVLAKGVDEVAALLDLSQRHRVPLTFRSGGTSFCGQAVTDGILVEVRRFWRDVAVLDGGERVRVKPGMIGGDVNRILARHARRIGPDPASINSCTLGGILANNSSGMCCGTEQNAYRTLDSLTFLLPSGTVVDTAAPDAEARFLEREPALAAGLLAIRRDLLAQPGLAERVRWKYRMKNTVGYGLNAFLDYERPLDILSHVLVGSEGTLAFLAEAVLRTVPSLPHRLTGLLAFPDLHAACSAIMPFREAGARALELMDWASIQAVSGRPGIPIDAAVLPPDAAALLVEFQEESAADLDAAEADAARVAFRLDLGPARFSRDPVEQARIWQVREGLYPAVAVPRPGGTTAIIEDVTFPFERLADGATDLRTVLIANGYHDAIIYGHARDGNLHFVLNQAFRTDADVRRYERLMDDVAELVIGRYDGALKAEHGTGRNVAPFVEMEWGPDAFGLMQRLKRLCDPQGLLNPGVILPAHPRAHLDDLKSLPAIEPEADRCIECGFCEKVCPSRQLTLTPRQRIVVRRELARLAAEPGGGAARDALLADWEYEAIQTCAADGLCETVCPMGINTGRLVKELRATSHPAWRRRLAVAAARRWALVEGLSRGLLRAGHAFESIGAGGALRAVTRGLRRAGGTEWIPEWTRGMPRAATGRTGRTGETGETGGGDAEIVYWASCTLRIFGPAENGGEASAPEALLRLARRAGIGVRVPDAAGTCCGVPWSSKGLPEGQAVALDLTVARLWEWSDEGRLPVVVEGASCSQGLLGGRAALSTGNRERFDRLTILDSVRWTHDTLLPRLRLDRKHARIAVHPPCAAWELGLVPALDGIARAMAEEVVRPQVAACCGFAGDRGFLYPELTAAALEDEAAWLAGQEATAQVSSNRTCEIGLSRATGRTWRNYLVELEALTRGMEGGQAGRRAGGQDGQDGHGRDGRDGRDGREGVGG